MCRSTLPSRLAKPEGYERVQQQSAAGAGGPSTPLDEILLAETAVRIELPPSLHRLAVERYEALRKYIERDASPLAGRVRIFYPQGAMAIKATIRSRKREDGFDIDIVAELTPTIGHVGQRVHFWNGPMLSKKSKIDRLPKSRESRFLAASAAASLCRTGTKRCGRLLVNRRVPSHRRASDAQAVLKNLVHLPEKPFSTASANCGHRGPFGRTGNGVVSPDSCQ